MFFNFVQIDGQITKRVTGELRNSVVKCKLISTSRVQLCIRVYQSSTSSRMTHWRSRSIVSSGNGSVQCAYLRVDKRFSRVSLTSPSTRTEARCNAVLIAFTTYKMNSRLKWSDSILSKRNTTSVVASTTFASNLKSFHVKPITLDLLVLFRIMLRFSIMK